MDEAHVAISSPGVLTITAQPVKGQPPATNGGEEYPINYLSGAVGAKQHFAVPEGGGLVFSASVQATTTKGVRNPFAPQPLKTTPLESKTHANPPQTWPAFWLSAVNGWPPEIDMAEWKGSGKISFNSFNTSSEVAAKDIPYPDPAAFHDIKCQLKDNGGGVVQVQYYMDGKMVTTQYARDYVGKEMWL